MREISERSFEEAIERARPGKETKERLIRNFPREKLLPFLE